MYSSGNSLSGENVSHHEKLVLSRNVGILPTTLDGAKCDMQQSQAIISKLPDCFLKSWLFPENPLLPTLKSVTEREGGKKRFEDFDSAKPVMHLPTVH